MAQRGVISFPIPPYSNPPIEPQFYKPKQFFISAIDLGPTTTITTTVDMDYVIGQLVRLVIPPLFGSRGLNEKSAYVIEIPASNQVVLDLDSNGVDKFTPNSAKTQPQIMAIGDINSGQINENGRVNLKSNIPGSFINISPA